MEKDIIDYMLKDPNLIPYEFGKLHGHSLEDLCLVRKKLLINLGQFGDKLLSLEEDYKMYEGKKQELLEEVIYLVKENINRIY